MSLNQRIILSATLVLVIFITLTAAALDRAFYESAESALRDRLTSQLYALMAAAEIDGSGVLMPSSELDALLGLPSSGVYAHITDQTGQILWRSSSVLGAKLPPPVVLPSGDKGFSKISAGNQNYYSFAYGVNWLTDTDSMAITFNITTDLTSFDKQINKYRMTLWGWLLAMAMLLLVSQMLILRWGLSPLRKVAKELGRIETGEQGQIEKSYPLEIDRLTSNINSLLQQERNQKTRYRNALGDLAHSLKTPLAVLQSGLSGTSDKRYDSMQQQITRMNSIVEYQLQRAATAGSASIGKSVNVRSVIERIVESLQKVYRDKSIKLKVTVDEKMVFKGDEGDLMEILGNLLDNAFKWTKENIEVVAVEQDKKLTLHVMDDGPGIEAEDVETILQRGTRADQSIEGHGIGLSIVRNIVDAYQGELIVDKSELGGADIRIII